MIAIWAIITGKQPTENDIYLFDYFWGLAAENISITSDDLFNGAGGPLSMEDARKRHLELRREYARKVGARLEAGQTASRGAGSSSSSGR